jgi:hypothetical protein
LPSNAGNPTILLAGDYPHARMSLSGVYTADNYAWYVSAGNSLDMNASSYGGSQNPDYSWDSDSSEVHRLPDWTHGIKKWQWDWHFDGSDTWDYTEDVFNPPAGDGGNINGATSHPYTNAGQYNLRLKVTDDDAYEGLGGDKAAQIMYKVNVVSVGLGAQRSYVGVNNDDDDEDGKMDKHDGGTQSAENDLVKIMLLVDTPESTDKVKLSVSPSEDHTRIKIWSDHDKQNLIIPDNGKYYRTWPASSVPTELWVEAKSASRVNGPPDGPKLTLTYIAMDEQQEKPVPRDPAATITFTFLEVDMDMDGVKDDDYTYPDVTEEITPGGLIPLHDVVKITLHEPEPKLQSLIPIDAAHPVTLRAVSGGSKIRIWENESKTGDPVSLPATYTSRSQLPDDLWVEGIQASTSVRDITLALEYTIAGHTFDDRIKVTVVEVTDVEWQTYPGNTQLAGCPKNPGYRIFPGKKTHDDPDGDDRRKVTVKATLNVPVESDDNIHVMFRCWDVDDPSANGAPIDPGDSDPDPNKHSIDNRGSFNFSGGGSSLLVHADSSQVEATFEVSMQPGDNYRVTATTCNLAPGELTHYMVETGNLPSGVKRTPMLTTWRKLHVERDSMEQVATTGPEKNWVTGVFDDESCSYDPNTNTTIVDLGQDLADCWEQTKPDHFVGGRFLVSGDPSWYWPLETIWHYFDDEIKVSGNCLPGGLTPYYLMDQDDWDLLPRLSDTGKLNSIFDDCYIECVNDAPGSSSDVGFKRNLGGAETSSSDIRSVTNPVRGSHAYEADNYWVVYGLSGFQPGYENDNDPDSELGGHGATETINFQASVIFLETSKDIALEHSYGIGTCEKQTVVHEIGHQVLEEGESAHTPNTIMSAALPVAAQYEKFSPAHVAKIRGQTSSPGS